MRYIFPYSLFLADRDSAGNLINSTDGDGSTHHGIDRPKYDTLIGVCNPFTSTVQLKFKFYKQDGNVAAWSDGSDGVVWPLAPGRALAITCIPNNVFGPRTNTPTPPVDFIGYGVVESVASPFQPAPPWLPVAACLGGGGPYPDHWNHFAPNVPVIFDEDSSIPTYRPMTSLAPHSRHIYPYAIPYYVDANHNDKYGYRTGLVLTNHESFSVVLSINYTVADVYPLAGQVFHFSVTLAPHQTLVKDLYNDLLVPLAGYPMYENSEGWVDIVANQTVKFTSYLLNSNRDYDRFAFGQAPWVH